ncbi:hypothetical protein WR25_01029 isoform D [Diploscapter pachys]|uniref:GRIP domain-containing protein n=1 Tax=Diploscapter pachys TaxID=2018661 RepID=A0A2A2JT03_9BILA|nr:hypothetical protein WR25_01029 isoform C [Diploscapter pachys]PAV64788.1 hypothetical protein WR25_01029 isoform D [Diploscapter pachys]
MAHDSGGLSREEFLRVQEQLIELRNRNYELQEELKRKSNEISQLSNSHSTKSDALQFASKLISRSKDKDSAKYEVEIENLQRKLATQEEEFRLQQETLFAEINKITSMNEGLKKASEISPENEGNSTLDAEYQSLKSELEKSKVRIEELEQKSTTLQELLAAEQAKKLEQDSLIHGLENQLLECRAEMETNEKEAAKKAQDLEADQCMLNMMVELKKYQDERETMIKSYKEMENSLEVQSELVQKNQKLEKSVDYLSQNLEESKRHFEEIQMKYNSLVENEQQKINQSVESALKEYRDQALITENKFQLEVSDMRKEFEKERDELLLKIRRLEDKISAKDEEKNMALKKQTALMKELQRSLKEERKRADSLEKKSEEKAGWHVVGQDMETRSSHTFDGNESISSLSALESDNVELINRLTTLQSLHHESVSRLNHLETENASLRKEIHEKSELIEHWIKTRAMPSNNSQNSSPREGGLKKFFTSALQGDESASDIKEMNKKLQRMLEETLSKNIGLQRVALKFSKNRKFKNFRTFKRSSKERICKKNL